VRAGLIAVAIDPAELATPIRPTRPCGATLPSLRDAGWECTGSGLIVVMMMSRSVPVVLPARALEIIDPEPWWDLPVKPFEGGDHFHLVVPRRPTDFVGDAVFTVGDVAMSMKVVNGAATIDDDSMWPWGPGSDA
jgi:hypothetical protein